MKPRNIIIAIAFTLTAIVGASAQTDSSMDRRHRDIAAVASLTARGDIGGLKAALAKSLDDGLTVNEAKEIIVHSYAYCGFPRAIRGLQTLADLLGERKARGISDNYGREASATDDKRTKYERGRDILAALSGVPKDAPKPAYAQLSPETERFLKEHLFCDLFERDVLTWQERELATVAVIAALGRGVEPMLRSHIGVALRIGVRPETLRSVFALTEECIGKSEAEAGRELLNEILGK